MCEDATVTLATMMVIMMGVDPVWGRSCELGVLKISYYLGRHGVHGAFLRYGTYRRYR